MEESEPYRLVIDPEIRIGGSMTDTCEISSSTLHHTTKIETPVDSSPIKSLDISPSRIKSPPKLGSPNRTILTKPGRSYHISHTAIDDAVPAILNIERPICAPLSPKKLCMLEQAKANKAQVELSEEEQTAEIAEIQDYISSNSPFIYVRNDEPPHSLPLVTGEDAISFFLQKKQRSMKSSLEVHDHSYIKFIRLCRSNVGKLFRPYDLIVATQSKVAQYTTSSHLEEEYFIMSANGLVHFFPTGECSFIPLVQWIYESSAYNVISSIHYFKYYLLFKSMKLWSKFARRSIYRKQFKMLQSKLFLGKKNFSQSLIQIRYCMCELQNVQLIDIKSQKTYEILNFVEAQTAKRIDATKQLETVINKVQDLVQNACNEIVKLSKITNTTMNDGNNELTKSKSKSMAAINNENIERKKKLKLATEEYSMLGFYIRLCDYIIVENLVFLGIITCRHVLEELIRTPRKIGLFETTMQFTENNQITFTPTCQQVKEIFEHFNDQIVETVNTAPRVIYMRTFLQYFSIDDAPHVGNIIKSTQEEYIKIKTRMNEKIENDYMDANEYVKVFDNVRPIYEYNKEWNYEEYSQRSHTVGSLKSDLLRLNTWEKELEKMRVGQTTGILHIESRKLKQTLLPMLTTKYEQIKLLLKDSAKLKCKTQLMEYKQRIQLFTQRPIHLKDFIILLEKLQTIKNKYKTLVKNNTMIDEMYRLLNTYNVRLSSEEMVQLDDWRTAQNVYKEENENVEEFINEKIPEMNLQLTGNIKKLEENMVQIYIQLQNGIFTESNSYEKSNLVLQELENVKQKLQYYNELGEQYNEYQRLFNVPITVYEHFHRTKEYFYQLEEFWNCVHEWEDLYASLLVKMLSNIDIDKLTKDLARIMEILSKSSQVLDSKVSRDWKDKVEFFQKRQFVLLVKLKNGNLSDRHWENLMYLWRQPYYGGSGINTLTIENLLDYKIESYGPEIDQIITIAQQEERVEEQIKAIESIWESAEIKIELYRIMDYELLLMKIEEDLVKLYECYETRHILEKIKMETGEWCKKLVRFGQMLRKWDMLVRKTNEVKNRENQRRIEPILQQIEKNWNFLIAKIKEKYRNKLVEIMMNLEEMNEELGIIKSLIEDINTN